MALQLTKDQKLMNEVKEVESYVNKIYEYTDRDKKLDKLKKVDPAYKGMIRIKKPNVYANFKDGVVMVEYENGKKYISCGGAWMLPYNTTI